MSVRDGDGVQPAVATRGRDQASSLASAPQVDAMSLTRRLPDLRALPLDDVLRVAVAQRTRIQNPLTLRTESTNRTATLARFPVTFDFGSGHHTIEHDQIDLDEVLQLVPVRAVTEALENAFTLACDEYSEHPGPERSKAIQGLYNLLRKAYAAYEKTGALTQQDRIEALQGFDAVRPDVARTATKRKKDETEEKRQHNAQFAEMETGRALKAARLGRRKGFVVPYKTQPDSAEILKDLSQQGDYGEKLVINELESLGFPNVQGVQKTNKQGLDVVLLLIGQDVVRFLAYLGRETRRAPQRLVVYIEVKTNSAPVTARERAPTFLETIVQEAASWDPAVAAVGAQDYAAVIAKELTQIPAPGRMNLLARVTFLEGGAHLTWTAIDNENVIFKSSLLADADDLDEKINSSEFGLIGERFARGVMIREGWDTWPMQKVGGQGVDLVGAKDGVIRLVEVKTHLGKRGGQSGLTPDEREPAAMVMKYVRRFAKLTVGQKSPTQLVYASTAAKLVLKSLGHEHTPPPKKDRILSDLLAAYWNETARFEIHHVNLGLQPDGTYAPPDLDVVTWGTQKYWRDLSGV